MSKNREYNYYKIRAYGLEKDMWDVMQVVAIRKEIKNVEEAIRLRILHVYGMVCRFAFTKSSKEEGTFLSNELKKQEEDFEKQLNDLLKR